MIHNPSKLIWSAPTERVDGTPISGVLGYRLYLDGIAFADFPGTLNPDGNYEAPLTITEYGQYTATLSAIETYEDGKSRESAQSNDVTFMITAAPKAPVILAVE
jgi:hypothetical protein